METNQSPKNPQRAYLFTVRLWAEELGGSRAEWRGRVEYTPTGDIRYFREWET